MFKFIEISSYYKCKICNEILKDPVALPCGVTICKEHVEEIGNQKCPLCDQPHQILESGYLINEAIQGMLDAQLYTLAYNFDQFNDSKKLIDNLNKSLKEIEGIRNDPEYFISEYFHELNRQVDLRRDKLFVEIQEYSDELIQKIDVLRQECLINCENTKTGKTGKTETNKTIDECKASLENLNSMFNTFEMNNRQIGEIMSQKISKEIEKKMKPLLEELKFELLGNNFYSIDKPKLKMNEVFGSLISIGMNMKVVTGVPVKKNQASISFFGALGGLSNNGSNNIMTSSSNKDMPLFIFGDPINSTINPNSIKPINININTNMMFESKIMSAEQTKAMLRLIEFDSAPAKKYTLLWRGTRDGFEASKFHSLCDGKPNTLTVVKTTTDCIFGGYTSVPWSSVLGDKPDNKAFLFSLKNPRNQPFKLNVIENDSSAVYHNSKYGPAFGDYDLRISNLSNTNSRSSIRSSLSSYTNNLKSEPAYFGDSSFRTVEVEVFQVV